MSALLPTASSNWRVSLCLCQVEQHALSTCNMHTRRAKSHEVSAGTIAKQNFAVVCFCTQHQQSGSELLWNLLALQRLAWLGK